MRTVYFVTVLAILALNAVQANRISQTAHTSLSRSKHTLQSNLIPKLSAISATTTGAFKIRATFANCAKGLKVNDFVYDDRFTVTKAKLTEVVKGVQYELTGTAKPKPDTKVPVTGVKFSVTLEAQTVMFTGVVTKAGVPNTVAVSTELTYFAAANFKSMTSSVARDANSGYIGFLVDFAEKCAPAAMKNNGQTLYHKYLSISSTSGDAKLFSVQPVGTSGSTCRSDIGDSDAGSQKCANLQDGVVQFQVWVTSTASQDAVTLTTKKGLCEAFSGGMSEASAETVYVNKGVDTCGAWGSWSTCDDGACFEVNEFFELSSTGQSCRSRRALPGKNCKVQRECRECVNKPCKAKGARPRSGETRTECFGCNKANYIGWTAPSGCKCGDGCEKTGDCCQSWYHYKCQSAKANPKHILKDWSPRQCSNTHCDSQEPLIDAKFPSYFCYCSANCAVDGDLCCDGFKNRNKQCAAKPPATAPAL